jgi:hypothetical protein
MQLVSTGQRRSLLARRQRLETVSRVDDVAALADALVAVHSSDPVTVYLSVAARMATPSLVATADALYAQRSVVRHHGMRRTLWVYTPEVARIVHASATLDVATLEWRQTRKWVQASGIPNADQWLDSMRDQTLAALHLHGPTGARQLGKVAPQLTTKILMGAGKYAAPQSLHTRLLLNMGFDASIVRTSPTGSWTSSEYQWAVMSDWIADGLLGLDPIVARGQLATRYLASFGPATTADLQWWTGWTLGATKAAIAASGAVEIALDGDRTGWLLPQDLDQIETIAAQPEPWVALLPALDSTAMGWKQREWYLGEWTAFGGPLFDKNGNIGPTVWVNGEVVGSWAQRSDGSVVFEVLRPVDRGVRREIESECEALRAVIGDARVTPRFPSPLQKSLAVG